MSRSTTNALALQMSVTRSLGKLSDSHCPCKQRHLAPDLPIHEKISTELGHLRGAPYAVPDWSPAVQGRMGPVRVTHVGGSKSPTADVYTI
jgi:hypothetical protein